MYPWDVGYGYYEVFCNDASPAKAIRSHYAQLSQRYGFKVQPLQTGYFASHNLLGVGRRLRSQERFQERLDLFKLGLEYYPNSAPMYVSLAETHLALKQHERALKAAEKAVQLGNQYGHAALSYYQDTLETIKNQPSEEK